MKTYDLVLDDELRDLIPPAGKESDERLKASIRPQVFHGLSGFLTSLSTVAGDRSE